MPALESEENQILTLVFTFCKWHALAKLRLHTDDTLAALDIATTEIGNELRDFADNLCPAFDTVETDKEAGARIRRLADNASKGKQKTAGGKLKKSFAIDFIKFHFIGDYHSSIPWAGTTDSYSTQTVSSCAMLKSC